MVRPTNEQASSFAERIDNRGRVLKKVSQGGPTRPRNHDGREEFAAGGDENAQYPTFPDYYYPDDKEEDTRVMWKHEIARRGPQFLGEVHADDKDIKFFERKANQLELARFKVFCEQSLERGTPWAKEYFEKIMPGWYQSKTDIIDEKIDIMKRLTHMVVNGVQSIEDMELLYMIYQGKIRLPNNFTELIKGRDDDTFHNHATFRSGIFCPRQYTSTNMRMAQLNRTLMANLKIPGVNIGYDDRNNYIPIADGDEAAGTNIFGQNQDVNNDLLSAAVFGAASPAGNNRSAVSASGRMPRRP